MTPNRLQAFVIEILRLPELVHILLVVPHLPHHDHQFHFLHHTQVRSVLVSHLIITSKIHHVHPLSEPVELHEVLHLLHVVLCLAAHSDHVLHQLVDGSEGR